MANPRKGKKQGGQKGKQGPGPTPPPKGNLPAPTAKGGPVKAAQQGKKKLPVGRLVTETFSRREESTDAHGNPVIVTNSTSISRVESASQVGPTGSMGSFDLAAELPPSM